MRTVTINGCFDGLHAGHIFMLGYARAQGDRLVVGINCDDYIRKKKRDTPFHCEPDRINTIKRLGIVDDVYVFTEDNPVNFIKDVKPDVHCISAAYGFDCVDGRYCSAMGIRVAIVPLVNYPSATELEGKSIYEALPNGT